MGGRNMGGSGQAESMAPLYFFVLLGALLIAAGLTWAYVELPATKFGMVVIGALLSIAVWVIPVPVALALLLPLTMNRYYTQAVGSVNALLVLGFTVVYVLRRGTSLWRLIREDPLGVPIVVFFLAQLLSLAIDPLLFTNARLAVLVFFEICSYLLLYFVLSHEIRHHNGLGTVLKAVIAVIAIEAAIALVQVAFPSRGYLIPLLGIPNSRLVAGVYSPLGTFFETELLSEFFAMAVPICLAVARITDSPRLQKLCLALVPVSMLLLLTAGARGGILALAIGVLAYLVMGPTVGRFSLGRSMGVAILVLSVAFASITVQRSVLPQYNYLLDEKLAGTAFEGAAPDTRARLWDYYDDRIMEQPVLGYGGLQIRSMFRPGHFGAEYKYPHSLYYYTLYSGGIIGFLPLVYLLFRLLQASLATAQLFKEDPKRKMAALLFFVAIVIFVADEYKIEYVRYVHYQQLIWAIFAAALGLRHLDKGAKQGEAAP